MATAQLQPAVTITTGPQQPPVSTSTSYMTQPPQYAHHMKIVRGLAISELVLGFLCFLVGIVLIGVASIRYSYISTAGEGLWCGIWIITAGAIGIQAVGQNSNRCLITSHMAFSIIGAVFSSTLFGVSTAFCFTQRNIIGVALQIILSFLSFASMIILTVSSSYCCYLSPGCCQQSNGQAQVVYVGANTQQLQQLGMPVVVQEPQGYIQQGYQPGLQVVQQSSTVLTTIPPALPATSANVAPIKEHQGSASQGSHPHPTLPLFLKHRPRLSLAF